MNDQARNPGKNDPNEKTLEPRDRQGFREDPAPQGLKEPPFIKPGDDSGEWTRGGGSDPNEADPNEGGPDSGGS